MHEEEYSYRRRFTFKIRFPKEMTEVTVRYFGILRELAGKRSEKVKIADDAKLDLLIKTIAKNHGPKFNNFLFGSDGKINKGLAYAVDGDSISFSELARKKCGEVNEFVILPPISGGLKEKNMIFNLDNTFQESYEECGPK